MARVIKTTLMVGSVATVGAALALGWQDIKRFVQIKQVSAAGNHPEKVPVSGRTVYPQHSDQGQRDGTGDFDSASRGGPVVS